MVPVAGSRGGAAVVVDSHHEVAGAVVCERRVELDFHPSSGVVDGFRYRAAEIAVVGSDFDGRVAGEDGLIRVLEVDVDVTTHGVVGGLEVEADGVDVAFHHVAAGGIDHLGERIGGSGLEGQELCRAGAVADSRGLALGSLCAFGAEGDGAVVSGADEGGHGIVREGGEGRHGAVVGAAGIGHV